MECVKKARRRDIREIWAMTGSPSAPTPLIATPNRWASRRVALAALALAMSGCTILANMPTSDVPPLTLTPTEAIRGFESDSTSTQIVTTLIGGKNVFIPSTIVVAAGQSHILSVYNTTDGPHGFRISGLGIEVVLNPGVETEIDLGMLEGNRVYGIDCHLHPPHRTATLVVVDGR